MINECGRGSSRDRAGWRKSRGVEGRETRDARNVAYTYASYQKSGMRVCLDVYRCI